MPRRRGRKQKSGEAEAKTLPKIIKPRVITMETNSTETESKKVQRGGQGDSISLEELQGHPLKSEKLSQEVISISSSGLGSSSRCQSPPNLMMIPLSPILNVDSGVGVDGTSSLLTPTLGPSFKTSTPLPSPRGQVDDQEIEEVDPGLTTPVKKSTLPAIDISKLPNVRVELEDARYNFTTPQRPIPAVNHFRRGRSSQDSESGIVFDSPIFVTVRFDSSNDEEENSNPSRPQRYKLRPRRNLFPKALTLQRYQPPSNANNSEDEEDEVLFVLDDGDSDYDDDEEDDYGRRATYGSRGPKADAKALSLISNCPTSVKWLMDNFEYHPGKSLPRGFVYDQYIILCSENGLDPLNAASFGKLIRSVFPGLKTRRLGTRGNSKYHYNGVYLRGTSPLLHIMNLMRTQEGLMYDNSGKRGRRVRKAVEAGIGKQLPKALGPELGAEHYLGKKPEIDTYLAELNLDPADMPSAVDLSDVSIFETLYHDHCKALLKAFGNFDLTEVIDEWKRFWRVRTDDVRTTRGNHGRDYNESLSKLSLFKVCSLKATGGFINIMDLSTYQLVLEILYPSMHRAMPGHMAQALKNMMKVVQVSMMKILHGYPKIVTEVKLKSLRAFMSMCYDYSRLNRMVGAVEQTLHFEDSIHAMRSELSRALNFSQLVEEASAFKGEATWTLVAHLLINFQNNLDDSDQSVEGWVAWTESLVDKLVNGNHILFEGSCLPKINRCWKFASDSMLGAIVKGSAATLGVFKVLVTWCDSLIAHMVMLETSRCQGFTMPIFYYASNLAPADESYEPPPHPPPQPVMAIRCPGPSEERVSQEEEGQDIRSFDLNQEHEEEDGDDHRWNVQLSQGVVGADGAVQYSIPVQTRAQATEENAMNRFLLGLENTIQNSENQGTGFEGNVLLLDSEMFSDDQLLGFLQENSALIGAIQCDSEGAPGSTK